MMQRLNKFFSEPFQRVDDKRQIKADIWPDIGYPVQHQTRNNFV